MYYIDKGLGIAPAKIPDHLNFVTVREDLRDQGDTLVRSEGTIDQALPRWNTAAG